MTCFPLALLVTEMLFLCLGFCSACGTCMLPGQGCLLPVA